MRNILMGLMVLGSLSAHAEILKVGVYSEVGEVTEFCHVNNSYVFVNGVRTSAYADEGNIFTIQSPSNAKIVVRDLSYGRGSLGCDKMVVEREDGSVIKTERIPGTINFEFFL